MSCGDSAKKKVYSKNGFALPTVLIASVVMLTVLLASISSTVAVRTALNDQYYNKLAQEAAEAGAAYAKACLNSNSGVPRWTNDNPLKPGTDCTGSPLSSCPVDQIDAICNSLTSSNNIRTAFTVELPQPHSDGLTQNVTAKGTTSLLRTSNTAVWRNYIQYSRLAITASSAASGSPYIQTITTDNCPSTRTKVQDARDNHTYWIQKLADGKCWMLTNLGYAGGGYNTYGDIETLASDTTADYTSYTVAKYYEIQSGQLPSTIVNTNYTTEPDDPSNLTDGSGQFGYLYNWCAAMGNQQGTAACSGASISPLNKMSICPYGWHLPTGGSSVGEFKALNDAINSDGKGIVDDPWLAQLGGHRGSGYYYYNGGFYWSSTQSSVTNVYYLSLTKSSVNLGYNVYKYYFLAVRCVADS